MQPAKKRLKGNDCANSLVLFGFYPASFVENGGEFFGVVWHIAGSISN